ncbi:AAA family ATPase [Nakamurella leprariae]|uniref:Nuclease SbcCD subunit C n=1 Tax=Nakamurella leprariae TaxID=2803911 RepID=A0A938YKN0_9ACTN|nr:SMC family ATPase [Nakamurella leprariae]MBM9469535.1 SMC family ATPase [Nakamurella leprariae]
MRLHRLELQAFGPFPGRIEVDLDAVGADGLFLLCGDTGAGKTTVLDAVAFALFGRVPGSRQEARRFRCDQADPGLRTEVRLELTVADQRIVLVRTPEYERPKSRGTGTTTEKHKVVLRWLDGGPAGGPTDGLTRADEVGAAIADLVGMTAEQFFQVVLLPQGQFARFLRSDTDERAALLERLFDTGRFGSVEDWFATARRESGARLRDLDDAVAQTVARVAEAAAGPVPDQPDEQWLAALRDRAADVAESTADAFRSARARQRMAGRRSAEARRIAELVARRAELQRRAAVLAEAGDRLDGWRAEVDAAGKAAPVVRALDAAAAAGAAAASAVAARDAAVRQWLTRVDEVGAPLRSVAALVPAGTRSGADGWPDGWDEADASGQLLFPDPSGPAEPEEALVEWNPTRLDLDDPDPTALRAAAAGDREQAGALAALAAEAEQQQRDLAALTDADSRRVTLAAELDQVDAAAAALPASITAAAARVAAADQAAARLPDATERAAGRRRAAAAATAVPELLEHCASAEAAAVAAVDAHHRAVDARHDLQERRIAGMASELARGLTAGEACPVCGGCDHPAPAPAASDAVTPAVITAAAERERQAAGRREAASAAAAQARLALEEARRSADGAEAAAAAAALADVLAEVAELRQLAGSAAAERDALELAQQRAGTVRDRHRALTARLSAEDARMAELRVRIAGRTERLEAGRAGFPDVPARRAALLARAGAGEAAAGASATARTARAGWIEAERAVEEALRHSGLADVDAARRAAAVDVDVLRGRISQVEQDTAVVREQLADPELAAVAAAAEDGPDRPDPATVAREAQSSAERADRALEAASGSARLARERRHRLDEAARALQAVWQERLPVLEADAELSALTDVVLGRGQNHRGISLRTYAVAAKLRHVVVSASARFSDMTGGRYSFESTTERDSRSRRTGLTVAVRDSWSGQLRSAKTLSGGETFVASLALALGLADVVAAESGGRLLDTLFIDEGFGSLDAGTLDQVMDTLDELRAGGRVVGLVSHVDELRQRIPDQIRVVRGPAGSSVQVHAAAL